MTWTRWWEFLSVLLSTNHLDTIWVISSTSALPCIFEPMCFINSITRKYKPCTSCSFTTKQILSLPNKYKKEQPNPLPVRDSCHRTVSTQGTLQIIQPPGSAPTAIEDIGSTYYSRSSQSGIITISSCTYFDLSLGRVIPAELTTCYVLDLRARCTRKIICRSLLTILLKSSQ